MKTTKKATPFNLFKKTFVRNVLTDENYNFINQFNVVENLACTILYITKHPEFILQKDVENVIKKYKLKQNVSANGLDYTCNCIEYDLIAYQAIEQ